MPVIVANNITSSTPQDSTAITITPVVTADGTPVTPDSLAITAAPANGVAAVVGTHFTYTPNALFSGVDSFRFTATVGGTTSPIATSTINVITNYNCACDDDLPTATLGDLQRRVLVHLGMAAMPTPLPGMAELVNSFLTNGQEFLYRKYHCFRTVRWYSWAMVQGQRFYDFAANMETCAKKLDARKMLWVGISKGDMVWTQLQEGINPLMYSSKILAIPQYFEVRQCIEVWPAPSDNTWTLRIKGDFGLLPFSQSTDVTTIDAEALFMYAVAMAKAHYRQPDAPNWENRWREYLGELIAGQHPTKRTWPGRVVRPNMVPPKMVP